MEKIRVRMNQTKHARHSIWQEHRYEAGKVYRLDEKIARLYISQGIAMEEKSIDVIETKKKRGRKKKTG